MKELLGLIVLTGPLFPMLVWLVISIVLTVVILHPKGNFVWRAGIRLILIVVIFLLPFVDEIMGRMYLKYLCETQGGFKVYHTVELPEEYWDENGEPRFIKFTRFVNPSLDKVNGTLDMNVLSDYDIDHEDTTYSSVFGIRLFKHWYYEKETGKVLAEG